MNEVGVNVEQIRALIGGEDMRRLIDRLHARMSRGELLTGKIQLNAATPNERAAIDRLMGRTPTQGNSLTIDLEKLNNILVHAEACNHLEDAVIAIVGPVANERALRLEIQQQWERLWQDALGRLGANASALRWIDDLKRKGWLKRLARRDVGVAEVLLTQSISIIEQVPWPGTRIAELAASKTGNSHALDRGEPLSSLVIRFARQLDESARWNTVAERRDAWETMGVLCDEVSAPVLVLNLHADNQSLTGQALNLHAAAGEPYRVSVRQLRRQPPIFDPITCGPEVFVCENPTVVDVAANRLGKSCRPLVCIDGQPKTASRLLLNALVGAGIQLRYHGDFDWDGIRIANTIVERHGAALWRFGAADYEIARKANHKLKGKPVVAGWDSNLTSLMKHTDRCVHEEEECVLNALLADLGPTSAK